MNLLDTLGLLVQDAMWSAVAALGFAVLFNVPRRALAGCALAAALGHAARTLLMQLGMEIELATLAGSSVIGFISLFLSQRWHAPMPIFSISAAVTLVPGVFAFRTMLAILEVSLGDPATAGDALVAASSNAIKTAFILGAIALGIAVPALLFKREQPVV
ncbi:MAG: threonine/serine exporter family protein [Anaerolineae bacterium]